VLRDTEDEVRKRCFPTTPKSAADPDRALLTSSAFGRPQTLLADRLASAWLIRRFITRRRA